MTEVSVNRLQALTTQGQVIGLRPMSPVSLQIGPLVKTTCPVDWRYTQKGVQVELLVKQSEFKRWLEGQGAIFKQGKKHLKVYVGSKQSTLPRHPSHEIGDSLRRAIIRQLGLK